MNQIHKHTQSQHIHPSSSPKHTSLPTIAPGVWEDTGFSHSIASFRRCFGGFCMQIPHCEWITAALVLQILEESQPYHAASPWQVSGISYYLAHACILPFGSESTHLQLPKKKDLSTGFHRVQNVKNMIVKQFGGLQDMLKHPIRLQNPNDS